MFCSQLGCNTQSPLIEVSKSLNGINSGKRMLRAVIILDPGWSKSSLVRTEPCLLSSAARSSAICTAEYMMYKARDRRNIA